VYLFLLSGVRREALNQVCFDETETSEENERSNAQLSNFFGFKNQPALESSKRRLSLARAHYRSCAREGITVDYDAFFIDWGCR
jgi:hypothetical protein